MTNGQGKKGRKSRFVGSWRESPFHKIEIPFTVENLKVFLAEGRNKDSDYTHQQIADWCFRFYLEFNELRHINYDLYLKVKDIALDVDTQWDLYLSNENTFDELKGLDFSKVRLPEEWFGQWLKNLENLH